MQACQISVGGSFFKGNGISIVIPRNSGILEWIRCRNVGNDEVTLTLISCYEIKLPSNWYENNDLLGFVLWCVYPSAHESRTESAQTFEIEPDNGLAFKFSCNLII